MSDILELGNGFAFKSGAYTESGRYKVLTIKNVQDGNVDCSSSSRLDELPIKMKEHCKLKPGRNARLSIPYDESTFQELSAILRPVFDGILANKIESLKLAKFRNLLLPKLMSGEIDVSKIDLTQLNSHLVERRHSPLQLQDCR